MNQRRMQLATVGFDSLRVLFVVWREPVSGARRTVGRLVRHCPPPGGVDGGGNLFEFAYTRGADQAADFTAFLAFPDLDRVYVFAELPPFFSNRLMSPRRPDYAAYVARIGLEPASDPVDILTRSGGSRATDTIELHGMPEVVVGAGGDVVCHRTWFLAHGFRHLSDLEQAAALSLRAGDALEARANPENPADANAVLLLEVDGRRVGFLPRYLAADVSGLGAPDGALGVTVAQVNPHPAPLTLRLLCRLDLKLPAGHTPFSGPMHRPRRADLAFDLAAAADPRTVAGSA